MRINSKCIPEHIRLLMPEAERRRLGKSGVTMPEIQANNLLRLEKKIQADIAQYLRLHDVRFNQNRMDRKTTCVKGWPDFTFVVKGRACFFEVKRPGEKPDSDQQTVIADLIREGAFVRVVHSLEEAITAYQEVAGGG